MRHVKVGVGGATLVGLAALLAIVWWGGPAGADGTEGLGPPSITIADGDDFVGAGVGLFGTEPGGADPGGSRPVSLTVPAGATVQQVLVYWEGQSTTPGGTTDTILVNGTAVTGQLIGGPTQANVQVFSQTYRADVTSLGVLVPGANTVTLGGLDFNRKNSGAGIFAILDTGNGAQVEMRDGSDFAYIELASPLDTTTPLTITFPTVTTDTVVEPLFFVSSVDNEMPRSSVIRFTFDTGDVVEFGNVLTNTDGDEWDTFRGPVTVPAGASSATVQILSQLPTGQTEGPQPASLVWNLAAVSVPTPAQVGGLQVVKTISGATEGYVADTVFTVAVDCDGTEFDTTFELTPGGPPGTASGMPPGTVCTVTETGVPDPAPGFEYGTPTYSPGQTVTIAEDTTVEVVIDNPLTPPPTLAVQATPICINDTPYIDYEAQLNQITAPNGATIRFTNTSTGQVVQELTNQPLAGRLLWPGAQVDPAGEPIDWPGWEFVNGEWIEVDDGLRPEIDLTVEVNPTATVRIDYPPPQPLCNPNPVPPEAMPDTGANSLDMSLFALILMALGGVFVVSSQIVRRVH